MSLNIGMGIDLCGEVKPWFERGFNLKSTAGEFRPATRVDDFLNWRFAKASDPAGKMKRTSFSQQWEGAVRASSKVIFNPAKNMQTIATNVFERSASPNTGEIYGISKNTNRTQAVRYASNPSAANWSSSTQPDSNTWVRRGGDVSFSKLAKFEDNEVITFTEDTGTSEHAIYSSLGASPASTENQPISVYIRPRGRSKFILTPKSGFLTNNDINIKFDTNTGQIYSVVGSFADYGLEPVGDGWWRVWLIYSVTNSTSFRVVTIQALDDSSNLSFAGNGLPAFDYTCPMRETGGQTFPGPFIPNYTTGSVTRNGDVLRTNDVSWLQQGKGSLFMRYRRDPKQAISPNFPRMFSLNTSGANNDKIEAYCNRPSSERQGIYINNSTVQADTGTYGSVVAVDGWNKIMATWDTDYVRMFANGGTQSVDASAVIPTNITELMLLGSRGTASFEDNNGFVAQLVYWPFVADYDDAIRWVS